MAQQKNNAQQDVNQLLQIRRDKLASLQAEGKDPFQITKYDVTHHTADIKDYYHDLEGNEVTIAGRMMSKRVMGKASFCHIQDLKGTIQSYVARDEVGEDTYKEFKKYDIGDLMESKVLYLKRRPERFPFMPRKLHCYPRVLRAFRKNFTA